jgi:hypothetical protein
MDSVPVVAEVAASVRVKEEAVEAQPEAVAEGATLQRSQQAQ